MILLYILGGILGLFLLYILFLGICALLVPPKKEYEREAAFTVSFWTAQQQRQ